MPSNFGVTPVDPSVLLKLLERQLQATGIPAGSNKPGAGLGDRGFLSLFSDEILLVNPVAIQFVTIKPTNWPVWQSVVEGVGETLEGFNPLVVGGGQIGFNAIATITCFAQSSADPEMKNANIISEDVLGITVLAMKAAGSVQFWQPKDSDNNDLLREPARITTGGLRYTPVSGKGGPWHKASFDVEFKFTCLLPKLE